ncbi:MAG: zinc ABC transporter solute-binding protein [Oligosphaeraceae bacterium]|mgnify:FL=1|nr:zinc ABC transporter solute-binding protein [Oligosphaeraceae bacterium]
MRYIFKIASALILLGTLCCASELRLFVMVPPQLESVRKIAKDSASIELLLPPGANPENFSPTAKQIAALSGADAIFLIGLGFETMLRPRLENRLQPGTLRDCRIGMKLRQMENHEHEDKTHADPHVWLSPDNMMIHAKHVAEMLSALRPENAALYQERYQAYCLELQNLKEMIDLLLKDKFQGKTILTQHPAFGYFLDPYGISQIAIESGGKEPGARHLSRLLTQAKEENIAVIFVQPQFSDKPARALKQRMQAEIISLDPLPEVYCQDLYEMAQNLLRGLTLNDAANQPQR